MRSTTGLEWDLNAYETGNLVQEIFEDRVYAPLGLPMPATPTIVDVGANVGVFVAFALREWPGAEVIALEPAPDLADILRANFSSNTRVRVIETAVGPHSGRAYLTYFPKYSMFSGIGVTASSTKDNILTHLKDQFDGADPSHREAYEHLAQVIEERLADDQVEVPMVTLESIVGEVETIDLLKLDVEGMELPILESMPDSIWLKVRAVALEPQLPLLESRRARELLLDRGFSVLATDRSASVVAVARPS